MYSETITPEGFTYICLYADHNTCNTVVPTFRSIQRCLVPVRLFPKPLWYYMASLVDSVAHISLAKSLTSSGHMTRNESTVTKSEAQELRNIQRISSVPANEQCIHSLNQWIYGSPPPYPSPSLH